MTLYSLGFLFTGDLSQVALIQKVAPEWQKGLWNGIGGKIEVGESPLEAMNREFVEETGYGTDLLWHQFGVMTGPEWCVTLFASIDKNLGDGCLKKTTEETPSIWTIAVVSSPFEADEFVPNVPMLVSMAHNCLLNTGKVSFLVQYKN